MNIGYSLFQFLAAVVINNIMNAPFVGATKYSWVTALMISTFLEGCKDFLRAYGFASLARVAVYGVIDANFIPAALDFWCSARVLTAGLKLVFKISEP